MHRDLDRKPTIADNLGEFVRRLRHRLRMTQEELAHALGITVGTVNRWENGRFRPSKLARATIVQFARRHGVPVEGAVTDPTAGKSEEEALQ